MSIIVPLAPTEFATIFIPNTILLLATDATTTNQLCYVDND